DDLVSRFAADPDESVRAAVVAARTEARAPVPQAQASPAPQPIAAPAPAAAGQRDPVRAALRRLVLEGGPR
ncbi:MAG TPA: hypothetical protein VIH51_07895, partial [Myxococcales bacterium]